MENLIDNDSFLCFIENRMIWIMPEHGHQMLSGFRVEKMEGKDV